MPSKVIRIDVFISSPSDVAEEREIVRRVIERLNRSILRDRFFVVPLLYEEDVPPQVGQNAQLIVDRYMHVQRSQVMVCMLWSRMGTPFTITETGDQFDSGTQYEFITGYENFLRHGHPNILLYRRMQDNAEADLTEKNRVAAFFDQFQGPQPRWKGLWAEYDDLREFEERLRNDLERVIRGLRLEQEPAWVDQPEFKEEARRLDAAMPQAVKLGEPTEVRAMICLPDSEGLAALLPHQSEDHSEISQEDVREGNLMIAFPKDHRSGELRPTSVSIQLESPDFEIREQRQTLLLWPGKNSVTAVASLTPLRTRERSMVIVRVKGRSLDGGEYLCGSTVLYTSVKAKAMQRITTTLWRLASLTLGGRTDRAEWPSEARSRTTAAVTRNLQQLQEIKEESEKAKRDAQPVNTLVEEFVTIMKSVEGGISSPDQLADLRGRLERVQQRIPTVLRGLRTDEGREACGQLQEAVQRNLQQLNDLERKTQAAMKEAEAIQALWERFGTKMEAIKRQGGISSPHEARALKDYFETLKRDAESARRNTSVDEAKRALSELIRLLEQVLGQLRSL